MGTNYYWRTDACEHCGRSDDELHICKSLVMFHGVFDWDHDTEEHRPKLTTWADWRTFISSNPGRIFDEYGDEHDVAEFIERVEATAEEDRRRQFEWCARHDRPVGVAVGCDWLDVDGFSFYGGEFS